MKMPGTYPPLLNPWWHATISGILMVLLQLLLSLFISNQGMVDTNAPWVVVVAMQLLYILANSISTFGVQDVYPHFGTSTYTFVALTLVGYLVAHLISPLNMAQLGELRLFLGMGWVGFIVLKSLSITIKQLMIYIRARDKEFLNHE